MTLKKLSAAASTATTNIMNHLLLRIGLLLVLRVLVPRKPKVHSSRDVFPSHRGGKFLIVEELLHYTPKIINCQYLDMAKSPYIPRVLGRSRTGVLIPSFFGGGCFSYA